MRKKRRPVYLTGSAAARILNVTRQAVSHAVYRGALDATGGPRRWRFPLKGVVEYAVQMGEPLDPLIERIMEELSVDWLWAATFVLQALGLDSVAERLDRETGAPNGAS